MHIESENKQPEDLGNARLASILATSSLVVALCTPVLLFIGIFVSLGTSLLALVLCGRDVHYYKAYAGHYTELSCKKSRKSRRRAILGFIITCLWLVVWAVNYGRDGLN